MIPTGDIRRVMIGAHGENRDALRALFQNRYLNDWEVVEAESFTQARYLLQFEPCDAFVVHQDLMDSEGGQGLSWLVWNRRLPVVFLSKSGLASVRAYELGASHCVSTEDIFAHPNLLAKVLDRAMHAHELEQKLDASRERLNKTRRHVDRLVNVLWRIAPTAGDSAWYSQRHMIDRLQEELSRVERHGVPLSVAIGELNVEAEEGSLPNWAIEAIVRGKRRSDVAGQYGQNGFLLLMVHTPQMGGINCVKRIQRVIEHPSVDLSGPHIPPRAYFGVSCTTDDRKTAIGLLRAAEESLEAARERPKERIAAG